MSTTNDDETSGPAIEEGEPPASDELLREEIESEQRKLAQVEARLAALRARLVAR